MNKILMLLFGILFFSSCEEKTKNISITEEVKTVKEEAKIETVSEKSIEIEISKDENISNTSQKIKVKAEQIVKSNTFKNVLPKQCHFGDIIIDVSMVDDKINIKSNNEFVEEMNISIKGKITSFIETDVNSDGFNEFYCVSNSGDLIAFCSYNNKSFGEIYINKKPNHFYNDCKEVTSWDVKNKKLSITFSNSQEELSTVRYKLEKGETSFTLVAE